MLGKIPFEDDRVVFQRWGELKPKTPFGQLPVMEVDGETYAQSGAMLQYAGKLAGLVPKDPKACLRVDEAIGLDEDLRGKIRPSVALSMDASVSPRAKKAKIAEMRKKLAEKDIPYYMSHFDKMLENKEYLTGSKPTVADAQFVVTTRYPERRHPGRRADDVPRRVPERARVQEEDGEPPRPRGVLRAHDQEEVSGGVGTGGEQTSRACDRH